MPRNPTSICLAENEIQYLESLVNKRTIEAGVYIRAKILLFKSAGMANESIAEKLDITRPTVWTCLKKYADGGVESALEELSGRGRKQEISDDSKEWVINIVSKKPTEFGVRGELWYPTSLTRYIRSVAVGQGHPRMARASESSIRNILREARLDSSKIMYYREKHSIHFEHKVHNVLIAYKKLILMFDKEGRLTTWSVDVEPAGREGNHAKLLSGEQEDEEQCQEIIHLFAAVDLLAGELIPMISDSNQGDDLIALFKRIHEKYPKNSKVQLVFNDYSVCTLEDVQTYLGNISERLDLVLAPLETDWLNMAEVFFCKMVCLMFEGMQGASSEDVRKRMMEYFDKINAVAVPYKWKNSSIQE